MSDIPEELSDTWDAGAAGSNKTQLNILRQVVTKRPGAPDQYEFSDSVHTRPVGSTLATSACDYTALEIDFRGHHATNAARRVGPYEHYRLIYRYGYDLATDARYRDAAWSDVEREARPSWEQRNPGTWAAFQDVIQYAWDQARRRRSAS